jgi:predicted RNA binding protein YcfA (HicA-like mRNA interferase family)
MPLKNLPYREVKRKLETAGFAVVSQKGSHVKFSFSTDDNQTITAIVPKHNPVAVGTLQSIIRQAGLTAEEFENL